MCLECYHILVGRRGIQHGTNTACLEYCHILQSAREEYNRKQTQRASSAVIFYSQQERNTIGNKHSLPRVLSYSTVSRRVIQQETNTACLECCHILQSAGGEYNSRQTHGTLGAISLSSDFLPCSQQRIDVYSVQGLSYKVLN